MSTKPMSILLVCALAVGCKHEVPVELAAARQAYDEASAGPAPEVVPAEMHKAYQALEVAEQSFEEDPKSYETRDLAYVAQRSSQKADALARIELEKRTAEEAEREYRATQTAIVRETREELAMSKESGARTAAELASTSAALGAAETARREADQRTAAALAALATVEEEQRGLVITLSGSVLFRSDEASLLPAAQTKLDEVAAALLATKERALVVEGHTDAEGDEAYNLDLSQRRAEAVRVYLIDRGYDAARIQARGIGEARPVADNESPEGRANNRRVEIVVGK